MFGAMFWKNKSEYLSSPAEAARRKWDSVHLRTVSCRVPTETYEQFKRLCYERGETVYSMIKRIVVEMVKRSSVENFVEK